jgi:uncharacterized protein YciI
MLDIPRSVARTLPPVAGAEDHHLLLGRVASERERGRIVMAAALGDPPSGAAFVFKGIEPELVEEFVRGDPYVEAGLVTGWRIEPWKLV